MANTLQTVVNEFRADIYPECSETHALLLANRVHRRVMRNPIFRNTTIDVNLTAGTREYAPTNITDAMRIVKAYYMRSATDAYELEQTTLFDLDDNFKEWRIDTTRAEPKYIYFTNQTASLDSSGPYVGFHDIPATTTSGGYPIVRLYVPLATDLALTDKVPDTILDEQVYLYGMAYFWAVKRRLDEAGYYKGLFEDAMTENTRHVQTMLGDVRPRLVPTWLSEGG